MRLLQSKTQQTAASVLASLFLTLFVAASVASLIVLLDRGGGGEQVADSDVRSRRSSSSSEEYVFRNRVHRVLWARGAAAKGGVVQERETVATPSPLQVGGGYLTPMERRVLQDTFIAVKTTKKFHRERLDVVLKTWFTLAREQVGYLIIWIYYHVRLSQSHKC